MGETLLGRNSLWAKPADTISSRVLSLLDELSYCNDAMNKEHFPEKESIQKRTVSLQTNGIFLYQQIC